MEERISPDLDGFNRQMPSLELLSLEELETKTELTTDFTDFTDKTKDRECSATRCSPLPIREIREIGG
jgi:hypothetical protein